MRSLPEGAIQRVLLARISAIPGVHLDRINVLVAKVKGNPRPVRSAPDGYPDAVGCARGRALAVEFKSSTGVQSDEQKKFQAKWERAGGLYILANDIDQALAEVLARIPPEQP